MQHSKKAQVTLFIILAILIVGGIIAYFALRSTSSQNNIPKDLQPVYDFYLSCLQENTLGAVRIMSMQAGYLNTPEFVAGSSFMPFSSQLDFLGIGVPYWMYVSGNNLLREQVPSISSMQYELSEYMTQRLDFCDFSDFELQGYDVYVEDGSVATTINSLNIELTANNRITIFFEGQSASIETHQIKISTKLGKFHQMAIQIYNDEKENAFLEDYAVDVMRLYAPVTGTEISCTPKIFQKNQIEEDLKLALESNIPSIKLKGNYYEVSSKEHDYFVYDSASNFDENINFLYSSQWPTKIEVHGDAVVEPIGLQEGLGILGFCYVPYHFVYDINFPVMVQISDAEELFQFPMAVIIAKSQPRNSLPSVSGESLNSPLCDFPNQDVQINTYDINLRPVESSIIFKCLNSICNIGQTKTSAGGALLNTKIPQCVNGFLIARAQGYADAKYQISSNVEDFANIILSKKYPISLDLGSVKKALVSFDSIDYSTTVIYPDQKAIELIEGYYNITVYVYENSTLTFPGLSERKCVDVPEEGIAGILGQEKEKCFNINIPPTQVSFAVTGGGRTQEYILEDQLSSSQELNINIPLFGIPRSLEDLQRNYEEVENNRIYLEFE